MSCIFIFAERLPRLFAEILLCGRLLRVGEDALRRIDLFQHVVADRRHDDSRNQLRALEEVLAASAHADDADADGRQLRRGEAVHRGAIGEVEEPSRATASAGGDTKPRSH